MNFSFLVISPVEDQVSSVAELLSYVKEFMPNADHGKCTYKEAFVIPTVLSDLSVKYFINSHNVPGDYDQFVIVFKSPNLSFVRYCLEFAYSDIVNDTRLRELLFVRDINVAKTMSNKTDFFYGLLEVGNGNLKEIDSILRGLGNDFIKV